MSKRRFLIRAVMTDISDVTEDMNSAQRRQASNFLRRMEQKCTNTENSKDKAMDRLHGKLVYWLKKNRSDLKLSNVTIGYTLLEIHPIYVERLEDE